MYAARKWTTQHGVLYYIYVTTEKILNKLQELINLVEVFLDQLGRRRPAGVREILFAINIDFLKIVFLLLIVYNNVEKIYNNTYLHRFLFMTVLAYLLISISVSSIVGIVLHCLLLFIFGILHLLFVFCIN